MVIIKETISNDEEAEKLELLFMAGVESNMAVSNN